MFSKIHKFVSSTKHGFGARKAGGVGDVVFTFAGFDWRKDLESWSTEGGQRERTWARISSKRTLQDLRKPEGCAPRGVRKFGREQLIEGVEGSVVRAG